MENGLACDTGTLLSLQIVADDFHFVDLSRFNFITSTRAEQELKDFAQHNDVLGRSAQKVLQGNLTIRKEQGLQELKKVLGVSGRQRITETDLSVFLIAQKGRLPFFTDDFPVLIHLSSFFPEENIFHGIALIARILSEKLSTADIYQYIFNKFIPKRWPTMTEQRMVDIDTILGEELE